MNFLLVLVMLGCALSVVAAQHKARRLYTELEREQARARQLEVEFGQLQLEAGAWAAPARVAKIARDRLRMQAPLPSQTLVVEAAAR